MEREKRKLEKFLHGSKALDYIRFCRRFKGLKFEISETENEIIVAVGSIENEVPNMAQSGKQLLIRQTTVRKHSKL